VSAFERGLDHFRAARYELAQSELLTAAEREPANPQAWRFLSAARFCLGDYVGALGPAQQCAALAPGDPAGHLNVAIILRKLGRWDEAREALDECFRQRPDYDAARVELSKHNSQAPLAPSWAEADDAPAFPPV